MTDGLFNLLLVISLGLMSLALFVFLKLRAKPTPASPAKAANPQYLAALAAIERGDTTQLQKRLTPQFLTQTFTEPNFHLEAITLLHYAVRHSQLAAVKLLLQAGANPNAQDADGNTPLHYVFLWGADTLTLAQVLLAAGANANQPNTVANGSMAPIHYAVEFAPDVLELLIQQGAQLNLPDAAGLTPLHYAVCGQFRDRAHNIQLLLTHGADPTLCDHAGQTARDRALPEERQTLFG